MVAKNQNTDQSFPSSTSDAKVVRSSEWNDLHYNFVIMFAWPDFWKAIIGESLYCAPKSRVFRTGIDTDPWLEKLFHYHWAYSVNSKVNIPFKRLWFRKMYRQRFDNKLPLCFVYWGGNSIRYDGGWCDYVRKMDGRNRQVVVHQDLISKKIDFDYEIIRNKVDFAVTLDKHESEQYDIEYFREDVYYKLIPDVSPPVFKQDVYLLAAAKDRLQAIMNVYDYLKANGVSCKFVLVGVPKDQLLQAEDIVYSDGITYEENLHNLIESKCILEIVQGGMVDITTRTVEAIAYGRKLITNCTLSKASDFNEGQLQVIEKPDDIDIAAVKEDYDPAGFPPQIDLNPMRRLLFIQEKLDEMDAAGHA